MTFNSLDFAIFFAVVLLLCRVWPRGRVVTLVAASFVFYSWLSWRFGLILFLMSIVGFVAPLLMQRFGARRVTILAVGAILIPLFVLKYWNFVAGSVELTLAFSGISLALAHLTLQAPPGLSFHTFQLISYVVDVYRKVFPIERRPGSFFLFSSFFPQLVSGPIERPAHLLPQLPAAGAMRDSDVRPAFQFFLYGLFLKVVIADVVGIKVDQIYSTYETQSGASLFVGTLLFYLQIYCDFAGYSLMAIGVARALGVNLVRNFNQPMLATSPSGFWRRWHISLSQWFRDYVYIPLGGSRGSSAQWVAAILVTFLLSGLWHGANWTFVAWGAVHGVAIVVSVAAARLIRDFRGAAVLSWFATQIFVTLTWVYFRAESIGKAQAILGRIGHDFLVDGRGWNEFASLSALLGVPAFALAFCVGVFAFMLWIDRGLERSGQHGPLATWRWPGRFVVQWFMIAAISFAWLFMPASGARPFIYFQF